MSAQTTFISQAQHIGISAAKADSRFSRIYRGMLASAGFAALVLVSAPALAATAPALGALSTHALSANGLTNNLPSINITGNYCYTSATNAPIGGTLTGTCNAMDAVHTSALGTLTDVGQGCTPLGAAVSLNTINVGYGLGVFPPGCYSTTGAMNVDTNITLSGPGVYIFKSGGTLDTVAGASVLKTAGACEADVFWAPTGGTTLNGAAPFLGSILSANAITVAAGNTISGRLLGSSLGAVTATNSSIAVPTCTTVYPAAVPTLSEWAMITFAVLIAGFGLQMMRRRRLA